MPRIEEQWEKVGPGAILLAPLAWLYAGGWIAYESMYRLGFKKAFRSRNQVICIGSLLAGGAGKTPVTLHIADVLRSLGRKVILSTPGYKAEHQEETAITPDGPLDPAEWGDETALLRWLRPDLAIIAGRRRVKTAELAEQFDPEAVLLMDDGFQHLPLHKDITIVIDPPELKNRFAIPAGGYREPWRRGKRRADLVLPGRFQVIHAPAAFLNRKGEQVPPPDEASILCAIGRPERFRESVMQAGVKVRDFHALPDHDPMTAGTLLDRFDAEIPIIVTGKDWMKLRRRNDLADRTILIATHEARITPEAEFRAWLSDRLNETAKEI